MIYCLLILLIFIWFITFLLNKRDLFCPSVIFGLSFIFSTAWACLYGEKWDLNTMYENTFFVILFGVIEFSLCSLLVKSIFNRNNGNEYKNKNFEIKEIKVDIFIKLICIIFFIVIIVMNVVFLIQFSNGNFDNFKEAINNYDSASKFSEEIIKVPRLLGISLIIAEAMINWFLYVAINNFIATKKIDKLSVIMLILYMIIILLGGGRFGIVSIGLAGIVFFYVLLKKKYSYNNTLKIGSKMKLCIVMIPIIILILFPKLATLIGRDVSLSATDYLAIYCGAPIKNLDLYLTERDFTEDYKNPTDNNQTFQRLANWIGVKLGIINEEYKSDIPFNNYKGFNLGNVYTIFYSYIYDYGYFGAIILNGLMAISLQYIYEKSKRSLCNDKPNIWLLIYGFLFNGIVLAFFSNVFYAAVFDRHFIFGIIFWILANYFFIKIKCRKNLNIKRNDENGI